MQKAESALKFYTGYKGGDPKEENAFCNELKRLKEITTGQKTEQKLTMSDICKWINLTSIMAITTNFFQSDCFT